MYFLDVVYQNLPFFGIFRISYTTFTCIRQQMSHDIKKVNSVNAFLVFLHLAYSYNYEFDVLLGLENGIRSVGTNPYLTKIGLFKRL